MILIPKINFDQKTQLITGCYIRFNFIILHELCQGN